MTRRRGHRTGRRARGWLASVPIVLAACTQAHSAQLSEKEPPKVVQTAYLAEWLPLGEARCQVEDVKRVLTEAQKPLKGQRVLPDVDTLAVRVRCEDAKHEPVALKRALPAFTALFLRVGEQPPSAPSTRTKLSAREPELTVFELAGLNVPAYERRFDAQNGAPLAENPHEVPRLSLESANERREIVLRARALDATFDAWLRSAAAFLSGQGPLDSLDAVSEVRGALDDARKMYRKALEELAPERLRLLSLETTQPDGLLATLALEQPRFVRTGGPVAHFRFELESAPRGYRITRVDVAAPRASVACESEAKALRARARKAGGSSGGERCNVLGLMLAGRCDALPESLREATLQLQQRCSPARTALAESTRRGVPEDFHLTLRRGRPARSLEHTPRYLVSLYSNGSVVFHGRSFVSSTERSDGRTSPKLLAALLARLLELGWFERRGGTWNARACTAKDPRGDVFTLRLGTRERMVIDREGCRGPFSAQELAQVRGWIEEVAGVTGWTSPELDDDPERTMEWIVSAD